MNLIKLIAYLIIATVLWDLNFKPYFSEETTIYLKRQTFLTKEEASLFIKRSPSENDWFECQNKGTGEHGYCQIKDIRISDKK